MGQKEKHEKKAKEINKKTNEPEIIVKPYSKHGQNNDNELVSYIYVIPEYYEIYPENYYDVDIYMRNYRKNLNYSNIKFSEFSGFKIYKAVPKKHYIFKRNLKKKHLANYKIQIRSKDHKNNKLNQRNISNKGKIQIKKIKFSINDNISTKKQTKKKSSRKSHLKHNDQNQIIQIDG